MNMKMKWQQSFIVFLMFTLIFGLFPATFGATASADDQINVEEAIQETVEHIQAKGISSEWEAIGVYQAGYDIPASYTEQFYQKIENQVTQTDRVLITDVERLAMAAHTINIDPRDVNGTNLIEKIYNSRDATNGSDSMTYQGINGPIFALIALDSGVYDVPSDARWTRDDLIVHLLNEQNEDGSWSLFGTDPSYDLTAMALIALGNYKDRTDVQTAIEAAVTFLSEAQGEEGGFHDPWNGGVSLESAAQVLIGLTSVGVDPTSEQFTKEHTNLVEHILTFIADDGGFKHLPDDTGSNGMATEQGLQALVAYNLFLNGGEGLYHFGEAEDIIEEPTNEVDHNVGEETPISGGETINVVDHNTQIVLPSDIPEGATLEITIPNEETTPYTDDFVLAGDWFDFTFTGIEGVTGTFELTLGIHDDANLDKVGMYHFNEEQGAWEFVEATVDQSKRTITANVNEFSVYAVFERIEEEEEEKDREEDGNTEDEDDGKENDQKEDLDTDGDNGEGSTDDQDDEDTTGTVDLDEHDGTHAIEDQTDDQTSSGEKLPETATNTYNYMLIGLFLLMIGSTLIFIQKQRATRSNE